MIHSLFCLFVCVYLLERAVDTFAIVVVSDSIVCGVSVARVAGKMLPTSASFYEETKTKMKLFFSLARFCCFNF